MSGSYDVAVIGLGAMGSAAAYHAASRGLKVVGFDQFVPPHELGSSTGESRIIREAYHEHPVYVPLVQRAFRLWSRLEKESGTRLYVRTRALMMGDRSSVVVRGARTSAKKHGLQHQMLAGDEIRRRFPAFAAADSTTGLLEPRGGALFPEACIRAHLEGARARGADLRFNAKVPGFQAREDGVRIATPAGEVRADKLIVTAGARLLPLVPELKLPVRVERQVMHWFRPKDGRAFTPRRMPVFIWEHEPGRLLYGFPDLLGTGIKVGIHHEGEEVDPDTVDRTVGAAETRQIRGLVRRLLPGAEGVPVLSRVCLYTNTPDETFLVDHHPSHPNVVIGSPCSGHGFKFASAIGEVLTQLAVDGRSAFDLRMFRVARWMGRPRRGVGARSAHPGKP